MTKITKIENAKTEVRVVIEGEKWQNATKKAFNKLKNKLDIKGFRKGAIPENIANKYISKEGTWATAAQDLAQAALEDAISENNLELIDRPSFDIGKMDENEVELIFVCPVKPDVTLGDYKSIKVSKEEVSVSEEEVNNELTKLQDRKAELELKEDGTVENGDTCTIDFEGFKDGVAFDGGKGENYDLVIGSGSFIPGFEDQLIGMKSEEEKEINVTFPSDYGQVDLAGKPCTFKVKVHEIKVKVLPELSDELVKDLKITDVNTVSDYKEYVTKYLTNQKERNAESKQTQEILDKLDEIATIDVPEVMVENEANAMLNDYKNRMLQQGLRFEDFLKFSNQSEETVKENFKKDALKKVRVNLILEEIAKLEKFEVSAEEVDAEYEKIGQMYSMPKEEVSKYIPMLDIKNDLRSKKALDLFK